MKVGGKLAKFTPFPHPPNYQADRYMAYMYISHNLITLYSMVVDFLIYVVQTKYINKKKVMTFGCVRDLPTSNAGCNNYDHTN